MAPPGDSSSRAPDGPLNTLRMAEAELEQLHAEFESIEHGSAAKRTHARLAFKRASLLVEMQQPGGTTKLRYACRNLSSGGVSLLHSAYLHMGTACVVHLPKEDGSSVPVDGKVVRCRFVGGKVHEIGVRFSVPISVHEFVKVDPLLGEFTLEHVDGARLVGSILHIAPAEIDRKLIRHFLADTGLSVVAAASGAAALERVKESFSLILSSPELGDMNFERLVERLLGAGVSTPVILVADSAPPSLVASARRCGIAAILTKPLAQETVLRAVAEFLLQDAGTSTGAAVVSSIPAGDPREALIQEASEEINRMGVELRACVDATKTERASQLCSELCSAARSMGFESVAQQAEVVRAALPKSPDQAWPARVLRDLIDLCVRARGRGPSGTSRAA